jgi:glycerol-3-phosphate dehydrogenase
MGVEMPILNEIHQILFKGKKPSEALDDLMGRELKRESL